MAEGEDAGPAPRVRIVHFADPLCWWSWGLEPVLQRLKEVYGDHVGVEYRMGGTYEKLEEWMHEYGVDEHSTVDWVAQSMRMTGMPVDPAYILRIPSTYPGCRAFKAAELQDRGKAERYLRRMMEAFMLEGLECSPETIARLASEVGLDGDRVIREYASPRVHAAFEKDRHMMAHAGVNFLSLMIEAGGKHDVKGEVFTGGPYEEVIDQLAPGLPKRMPADILDYMERNRGKVIPPHEVAVVFRISDADAAARLRTLADAGLLKKRHLANTSFFAATDVVLDKLPLDLVKVSHVTPQVQVSDEADLKPIITEAVKNLYTEVATRPDKEYHFPLGLEAVQFVGYPDEEIRKLPPTAVESFAGVGYPFATNSIQAGDTVLDIGSGSGTDVLYASLRTGPKGTVFGLDITPAMIAKARANIEKMGAKNVTILEGEATKIPRPDGSIDVVTSNGVLNLVPDKPAAFMEIFRVLKHGGRLQLADIVVQEDVGAVCGINPQLWADCIGGAAVESEYMKTIGRAGFEELRVVKRMDYFSRSNSESTKRITKTFGAESIVLAARKP